MPVAVIEVDGEEVLQEDEVELEVPREEQRPLSSHIATEVSL